MQFLIQVPLNQLITLHYPDLMAPIQTDVQRWARMGMQMYVGQWIGGSNVHTHTCQVIPIYTQSQKHLCIGIQTKSSSVSEPDIFLLLFTHQGVEVRQGVFLILLTAPTTGNEELDYGMIGLAVCLWLRLSTGRGWLLPPAEHNGLTAMPFKPKLFMHNCSGEKTGGYWLSGAELRLFGLLEPEFYCMRLSRTHGANTCTSSSVLS